MNMLVEIEQAVGGLPSAQKAELLLFVAQSLREEQAPLPEPRVFSDAQRRTLVDAAVGGLPSAQKAEWLLFVAQSLREEQAPLPEPRLFSDAQLRTWMDEDEEAMRH